MTGKGVIDGPAPQAEALLAACRQRAAENRREIAQVTEALAGTWRGALTDRQRAQMGNMLRRLVGEIAVTLHNELVAALERRGDLAREAVAEFAAARPADPYEPLVGAGLLLDPLLVEAALHRMFEHMLETALRPSVSDPWQPNADLASLPALAEAGRADRGLADALAGYGVARAQGVDAYGEPVLRPDELAHALVERLHWRVAATLRGRAADAFGVAPEAIDAELQQAVAAALGAFGARVGEPSATDRAVSALSRAGALDGALVLDVLRQAEVPLFIVLFAALTRLPPRLLRRLVFEADGTGLAVAARAGGMTSEEFAAMYRLTRHARAPAHAAAPGDVNRLIATFERIAAETAAEVCDYWRLPADYLDAIWRVSEGGAGERNANHY